MNRALAAVTTWTLAACTSSAAPPARAYRTPDSAFALSSRIAEAVHAGNAHQACGHPGVAAGGEFIIVTGQACLSCRGIGNLVRTASRTPEYGQPTIAIPVADTGVVCPFLREERVRNPVLAVPDSTFPGEAVGATVVIAVLDQGGQVSSAIFGRDGVDLLPRLDSLRRVR